MLRYLPQPSNMIYDSELNNLHQEAICVISFQILFFQFNFVGKILGPQGNTIKRLQEETGAKISVLGKGSMRDKAKVRMSGGADQVHAWSPFETNI